MSVFLATARPQGATRQLAEWPMASALWLTRLVRWAQRVIACAAEWRPRRDLGAGHVATTARHGATDGRGELASGDPLTVKLDALVPQWSIDHDGHAQARGTRDAISEHYLRTGLRALVLDDREAARDALSRLMTRHLDPHMRPGDIAWYIFAAALRQRVEPRSAETNLYLRPYEIQQIELFNLLTSKLPIVRLANRLVVDTLAALVEPGRPFAVLDVGIGTGQQEVALIRRLARERRLPARLRVLAVEPNATSLSQAQLNIAGAAACAGVPVEFTSVNDVVENLGIADWSQLRAATRDVRLVVNAAFALHHVLGVDGTGPLTARSAAIDALASLEPAAIVLCEPHSDHQHEDLERRFEWCLWHYGTVFALIDRLEVTASERKAMKLFFAREIDDVLGEREQSRCERHEPVARWMERLERAGLRSATGFEAAAADFAHGVRIRASDGHAEICVDGDCLVAVLCVAVESPHLELGSLDDPDRVVRRDAPDSGDMPMAA